MWRHLTLGDKYEIMCSQVVTHLAITQLSAMADNTNSTTWSTT